MRILVTRPQPAADALANVLRAAGHDAVVCPALELRPTTPAAAATARLSEADLCIFVSVAAVRHGWPWLAGRLRSTCRVYAVGPSTEAALRTLRVACEPAPSPGSAAQLLAMPALQRLADQRVLVVRGRGGLDELPDTLAERGARVTLFEPYERQALNGAQFETHAWSPAPNCVFASSGEGVQALVAAAGTHRAMLLSVPLLVPSSRVAVIARELGFARVIVCDGAGDAAVSAAIAGLT
jgi:uroporphyrinogen-III synthase